MKKISIQQLIWSVIIACMTMIAISSCHSRAANENPVDESAKLLAIPALFERKGELAKASEWQKTKEKVAELNKKIDAKEDDVKARLQIASIYMSEARITGEHPYYYPAILQILDGVLSIDGKNFEALVYKASVKMSQHQFAEAKTLAEKARSVNPDNAYVYGVLVDANVELGNYEEAVQVSDKMQALKPSLESYSRASYLREIYGDYNGAIEAMKLAVQAGLPGSEPQCWSKKTLAHLYEKTGQWKNAEIQYREILAMRPSYAFALEGLAKVAKQNKNFVEALQLLEQASAIMPEFSFQEEMAAIYELEGNKQAAQDKYDQVIKMLKEDEASGHIVALEMCRVYMKAGMYTKALEYAKLEYASRPLNIDVNSAMAWASYMNKEQEKATGYMKTALRTGSKDPELRERAAMIGVKG
ncbi:MAG TPA: tetratricopeptide repeat protein [Chitinophagaceae bacterium]|jgi:tetratricopeptide (TPR) repeat protein|nr:tetratricopeptide repeat protein [Chitinophagaceae bacterium]